MFSVAINSYIGAIMGLIWLEPQMQAFGIRKYEQVGIRATRLYII